MQMIAIEIVARALAAARARGRGMAGDDRAIDTYVARRWKDHEADARRLLRELKDQPPQIVGAGASALSANGMVNAIFEAMASEALP
jgi:hypothetical protein